MSATVVHIGAYTVAEDGRGWTVTLDTGRPAKDRQGNATGETVKQGPWYYSDLPACLRSILSDGYRGQGKSSIDELLHRQEFMYQAIKAAVPNAQPH